MATAASWKPLLLRALDSNAHLKHSAFFQLATIGSNGRPSNRTVVFRGFQEDTNVIQINTDRRSAKIEEIKHCHFGEQREKAWFASSLKSRLQYLAPAPRLPDISNGSGEENQLDPSEGPVEAFCLLLFDPEQVDYLNLKSNERFIFTSRSSEQGFKLWMSEKVNP
ncbi:pyridoxine/pyridoxamine 5'-phosphate oxidase 2-like isoform X5 [Musa acuminata AAA Group]|uniref:pyridoxine/pyridoxamine 5'-phosphate oxidase 2-like isoform X5 n=1 Tax=Musa acuminata AAA Group TaxID=214697 RepID=UPI0031CF177A